MTPVTPVALQNVDLWREQVAEQFRDLRRRHPERFERRLALSWSNWGFGIESLETSAARLARAGLSYIELHGNHYGPDLGYQVEPTLEVLRDHGLSVSGVCGMFSDDNDLSSNRPIQQQEALAYIRREIAFTRAVGGGYLLVVPASVGRAEAYDASEWHRSVEALRLVADEFTAAGIKAAIEPIRAAETTLVHTVGEAIEYIEAVGSPGVQHINGDVYHMQVGEKNIPLAILEAGDRLLNLHMADSNRAALGQGSMDLDTIIQALYLVGHNAPGRFVTPEPLGPGGAPYPARYGRPAPELLDALVDDTVTYFREREEAVLAA
ncbi:sugar phosphate isomerase/epimerase family protein [Cellulomonas xiejunii]|uniref:Sugar phosphate isomerase/epimerase n=1 Tax=Cellulomonas xiejunii TaxID=2968083 RepID=A0ABY5KNA5_9CELL|nr:sugar phosphate isomerase/epimerase [Cellulomonas xiejunii]MCC2315926.1 sugar phosphate isomerase/epimerase [Cellulomonas xiejunii]MCC2320943.1 sugar phosphate isomerase/epimerase [Cellulomonas xiejunii]UUI71223.1 sugar phosphate isomerase/epimerase [Cellulomonas xiejunii]